MLESKHEEEEGQGQQEKLSSLQQENERLKQENEALQEQVKKHKSELAEVRSKMLSLDLEVKDLQEQLDNAPKAGCFSCFGPKRSAHELAAPGSTSHPARNKGGAGVYDSSM